MLQGISTHTPHARRDMSVHTMPVIYIRFLLTRLMRGVTINSFFFISIDNISTHTPHARRDTGKISLIASPIVISTHTPHARRDYLTFSVFGSLQFLLTRLMRGVTPEHFKLLFCHFHISTHTPHARRDIPLFLGLL